MLWTSENTKNYLSTLPFFLMALAVAVGLLWFTMKDTPRQKSESYILEGYIVKNISGPEMFIQGKDGREHLVRLTSTTQVYDEQSAAVTLAHLEPGTTVRVRGKLSHDVFIPDLILVIARP